MARITGLDPHQISLPMRLVIGRIRKLLGKDLTPLTIQARDAFSRGAATEAGNEMLP